MFNFSNREKNILISGVIFLVLFFGLQLGIVPVFEKRDNLHRILNDKQAAVKKMVELQQQFLAVSSHFDTKLMDLTTREKNFSLFSFLDALAQQNSVKENVVYMKPFTKEIENSEYLRASVKVKLKEVYLKELVDFIYRIESSENTVTIKSLSLLKAGKKKTKLDVIIEAETLIPKDKV